MKKIFSNNRIIAIALLTMFSVTISPAVNATEKNPSVPVTMSFIGNINNQPVFQLNFNGDDVQNDFTIIINDQYGNSLYSENIRATVFSKKFALNAEELGDDPLTFIIYSNKTKTSIEYTVNRNTRLVQEVTIRQVK